MEMASGNGSGLGSFAAKVKPIGGLAALICGGAPEARIRLKFA
jgi:hypothetical protein